MCPVCFFVENSSESKLCEICSAPNPGTVAPFFCTLAKATLPRDESVVSRGQPITPSRHALQFDIAGTKMTAGGG